MCRGGGAVIPTEAPLVLTMLSCLQHQRNADDAGREVFPGRGTSSFPPSASLPHPPSRQDPSPPPSPSHKPLLCHLFTLALSRQIDQMFAAFPPDISGNLDYKNLVHVITHGEEKD